MGAGTSAAEEIKSRCNIVDVIGRVVPLKRAGSNYKGICPFHNEKTPSFVVSETKQIFTCFGCGATGDVIGFVRQYYNLDFIPAMEKLADEYGITIETGYGKSQKKERAFEANKEAAKFFFRALRQPGSLGYAYMHGRGIEPKTLNKFGIGYADGEWQSLYDYLTGMGYEKELLLKLGLISESRGKYYDKFRNRVIFPIFNTAGKVIGFGGRIIGEGNPKYLNSRESDVFLKKNNLYGLNLTRQEIEKENRAVLVEGYMDVVSLYQSGVRNGAASLGTALTENQAKLLHRYTDNVVLSYDADQAGINAALRGLDILYREQCKVKVLHISDGKDPDEFIKKNGKQAFLQLMDRALPYGDYKLNLLKDRYDLTDMDGRVDFLKAAVEVLQSMRPVEADLYIKKLAEETKISEQAIRLEINGNHNRERTEKRQFQREKDTDRGTEMSMVEKDLIKILLTSSQYCPKIVPYETRIFKSAAGWNIYSGIKNLYRENEELDRKQLADSLEPEDAAVLKEILKNVILAGKEEQVFRDCIQKTEQQELQEQYQQVLLNLSLSEEENNREKIQEYTKKLMDIQKKMIIARG